MNTLIEYLRQLANSKALIYQKLILNDKCIDHCPCSQLSNLDKSIITSNNFFDNQALLPGRHMHLKFKVWIALELKHLK